MRAFTFLVEYLKNPRSIGSLVPSSRFLARTMLHYVDFSRVSTIIELGAGTGNITEEIARCKKPGARLLSFEPHPLFYKILVERFHNNNQEIQLVQTRAENFSAYLRGQGLSAPDAVISSLPLATWSPEHQFNTLELIAEALPPRGVFVQFQYLLPCKHYASSCLKELFLRVYCESSLLNIPPARVYTCVK